MNDSKQDKQEFTCLEHSLKLDEDVEMHSNNDNHYGENVPNKNNLSEDLDRIRTMKQVCNENKITSSESDLQVSSTKVDESLLLMSDDDNDIEDDMLENIDNILND